jgi:hypothetical protein
MEKKVETKKDNQQAKHQQDLNEHVQDAYQQAEKDIADDADLSIHSPNDDLDEAETARLGDGKNDLV